MPQRYHVERYKRVSRSPTEMDTGHDNNLLPFLYVSRLKFCCVNERIFLILSSLLF